MANESLGKFEQIKVENVPANHPEQPVSPERSAEAPARPEAALAKEAKNTPEMASGAAKPAPAKAALSFEERRAQEIDQILSDGLNDAFLSMSPAQQKNFKSEGEETVRKINVLMDKASVNIGKIVSLIKKWLRLVPGINRFFLDQEAKIKADKIARLKNRA